MWILMRNLTCERWQIQAAILDPRLFGVRLGRPRLYALITHRETAVWNTSKKLHILVEGLAAFPVMDASCFFHDPDPAAHRPLTSGERKRKRQYSELPGTHRLHKADVWDLSQSTKRPRGSLRDTSLPTFTTSSNCLMSRALGLRMSPTMLMRALGYPTQPDCDAGPHRPQRHRSGTI